MFFHWLIVAVSASMPGMMEQESLNDMYQANVFPRALAPRELCWVDGVQLELGVLLANTRASTVWTANNNPNILLKYHVKLDDACFDFECFHPLSREFFMMKHIEHLGISLKVFYLSASSSLPAKRSPKFVFTMSEDKWRRNIGAPVRFMVVERGTHSASQLNWGTFERAARITSEMLKLLRTLHDQGKMVHGDAHAGNFVMDKNRFLKMIDFSNARFVETPTLPLLPRSKHSMHSPWEMRGFVGSRRDDVFRVVLEFANALTGRGRRLFEWYDTLSWHEHFETKSEKNLFARSIYAERMEPFSKLVQGMVDVTARPPYEELLAIIVEPQVSEQTLVPPRQVEDIADEQARFRELDRLEIIVRQFGRILF